MAFPGVFKRGYIFQRGDLPLFITDSSGNATNPYKVTFTLYYRAGNSPCELQVGPIDRTPVQAKIGEYYVSGVAGECGQPGQWYVEWKYQESFGSQWVTDKMGFSVFETTQFAPVTYTSYPCGCGNSSGCGCTIANPRGGCQWGCRNSCLQVSSCGKYGW